MYNSVYSTIFRCLTVNYTHTSLFLHIYYVNGARGEDCAIQFYISLSNLQKIDKYNLYRRELKWFAPVECRHNAVFFNKTSEKENSYLLHIFLFV